MALAKVGNFTKPTAVGNQVIAHGLGEIPKVIIIWMSYGTGDPAQAGLRFAIGITGTIGGIVSSSFSLASGVSVATTATSSNRNADAIHLIDNTGAYLSRATITAVDATNITLNWSLTVAVANRMHFAVIGGLTTQAKVADVTLAASGILKSVTGVGFTPDTALLLSNGVGAGGAARLFMGAFESYNMAMAAASVLDETAVAATGNHAVSGLLGGGTVLAPLLITTGMWDMWLDSLDVSGFTLNDSTQKMNNYHLSYMALKGVRTSGGLLRKTGEAVSTVSLGYRPEFLLLFTPNSDSNTLGGVGVGTLPNTNLNLSFGASDGTTTASTALFSKDAVASTDNCTVDRNTAFITVDAAKAVDNSGTVSFNPDGFVINWTVSKLQSMEFFYLALGTQPPATFKTTPRRGLGIKVLGNQGRGVIKI